MKKKRKLVNALTRFVNLSLTDSESAKEYNDAIEQVR
jgi:hypothetical protein